MCDIVCLFLVCWFTEDVLRVEQSVSAQRDLPCLVFCKKSWARRGKNGWINGLAFS
jgi:hypothetical protein